MSVIFTRIKLLVVSFHVVVYSRVLGTVVSVQFIVTIIITTQATIVTPASANIKSILILSITVVILPNR